MEGNADLLIADAGPAGLASAIAARQFGLDVMVVDGRSPPIDQSCGKGLMPDSIAALYRFGNQPPLNEAAPFQGICFLP